MLNNYVDIMAIAFNINNEQNKLRASLKDTVPHIKPMCKITQATIYIKCLA